ncbi:unnamed protein product, partial [Discosporangium mesarthrocarpum]
RKPLTEVGVDPDVPLPLPLFPGRGMEGASYGGRTGAGAGATLRGTGALTLPEGGVRGDSHSHYVPDSVAPQQRQSHGLPPELRAIVTIPRPERMPGAGTRRKRQARPGPGGTGGRGRGRGAVDKQTAGKLVWLEREQSKAQGTMKELRKDMTLQERRLEKELDKLRRPPPPPTPSLPPSSSALPRHTTGVAAVAAQNTSVAEVLEGSGPGWGPGGEDGEGWYKVLPVSSSYVRFGSGSHPGGSRSFKERSSENPVPREGATQTGPSISSSRESLSPSPSLNRAPPPPQVYIHPPTHTSHVSEDPGNDRGPGPSGHQPRSAEVGGSNASPRPLGSDSESDMGDCGQAGGPEPRPGLVDMQAPKPVALWVKGVNKVWQPRDDDNLVPGVFPRAADSGRSRYGGSGAGYGTAMRQVSEGEALGLGEGEARLLPASATFGTGEGPGPGARGIRLAGGHMVPPQFTG